MMSLFETVTRVMPVGSTQNTTTYAVEVPDGWQQGRGAFGGLVLATLLRAIEASEPDAGRKTRTLIGDIAGPVMPGAAEVVVTVLRRGANQSNLRADLVQKGEVLAFASAVLSTARTSALPPFPAIAAPPGVDQGFFIPADAPGRPPFGQFFDQHALSGVPFMGGTKPEVTGWVRAHEATSRVDAPLLVAYLDSFWPAFFAAASMPRPTATVSFTAEILRDLSTLDPEAPLFYRARTLAEHEGFQLEERELFDAGGRLVAANQQTFVVIK